MIKDIDVLKELALKREVDAFIGKKELGKRIVLEIERIEKSELEKAFDVAQRISAFLKGKDNKPHFIGKGCCSLMAYLIGITDINPFEYGLIFERYFNEKSSLQVLFGFYMDVDTLDELTEYLKENFDFVEIEIGARENVLHVDNVEIPIITSIETLKEIRDWACERMNYLASTPYIEDYMHFIHYIAGYDYDEIERIRRTICSCKKDEIDALEAQFIKRCPQWITYTERFALFDKITRGIRMSISKAYCISAIKILQYEEGTA